MKKHLLLILLTIILAGCMHEKPATPSVAVSKIRVSVSAVASVQGKTGLHYSGTIEAAQTIPLSFQTTGIVENVYVDAGDFVKKGQLLASVDETDLRNIYASSLSKYNQARDAYDRLKQVHDQGSLPEIKWVEMQTNLDQAKAALELAKNNLGKCKMVAPADAMVGKRNIEPGQSSLSLVSAPIELVKIDKVMVKVAVPESEINRIRKGTPASFSVPALGDSRFDGVITNVSPVAEIMSRTYTVKIMVDNPGEQLKPGMICDVVLRAEGPGNFLVVPYRSVIRDADGKTYVFLVSEDRHSAKKQRVTVGDYHENGIEITSGLMGNETVVTGGVERLSDNCKIDF